MALALVIGAVAGGARIDTAVSEREQGRLGSEAGLPRETASLLSTPYLGSWTPGQPSSRSETRRCPDHRRGLAYYRSRHSHWTEKRGARSLYSTLRKPRSCPDARYLAVTWRKRARVAWRQYKSWQRQLRWDPELAIIHVFGSYASQALAVAACESGWARTPRAQNGQYLGMFQMGEYARSRYGHGPSPLEQARAAYAYFADAGYDWSPWACKP